MDEMIKYIFQGALTLGVGIIIWEVKDFKESLTKLTESLTEVTISLKELIVKDQNKDEKIGELKAKFDRLEKDVQVLKLQTKILEQKNKP